ncbi:MAG: class II glutamine amidotransferase [Candidatus Aminicenantaceae bacterium]
MLLIKSLNEFPLKPYLETFSEICLNSNEYQGHGWGIAYLSDKSIKVYKNINPIWEHDFQLFGYTTFLMAHARSAFKNNGLTTDNNMPFFDGKHIFLFNGELNKVKISIKGRTGAEKIFNFIKRFNIKDMESAFHKAISHIQKRTVYIKAMNIIMSDITNIYLCSIFNQQPDYYTLYMRQENGLLIICSEKFPPGSFCHKIKNRTIKRIK